MGNKGPWVNPSSPFNSDVPDEDDSRASSLAGRSSSSTPPGVLTAIALLELSLATFLEPNPRLLLQFVLVQSNRNSATAKPLSFAPMSFGRVPLQNSRMLMSNHSGRGFFSSAGNEWAMSLEVFPFFLRTSPGTPI